MSNYRSCKDIKSLKVNARASRSMAYTDAAFFANMTLGTISDLASKLSCI